MFSQEVKEQAMVSCGRRCCLCHKFCGVGMECHHILGASKGGEDTIENCIPLCFDCHAEVGHYSTEHPKGIKFTESELRLHRDRWYESILKGIPGNAPIDHINLDITLFKKLYELLGGVYSMTHFKNHDYGSNYLRIHDEQLIDFFDYSNLPQCEFFNVQMEAVFADLKNAVLDYNRSATNRIFWETNKTSGIPREWSYDENEKIRERRVEAVETMNKKATQVWNAFSTFLKEGRRQLNAEIND